MNHHFSREEDNENIFLTDLRKNQQNIANGRAMMPLNLGNATIFSRDPLNPQQSAIVANYLAGRNSDDILEITSQIILMEDVLSISLADRNFEGEYAGIDNDIIQNACLEIIKENFMEGENANNRILLNLCDPEGNSPLHIAVRRGSIETMMELLKCPEVNPNLVNEERQTPIHTAINMDDPEKIIALLRSDRNIDLTIQNFEGQTPTDLLEYYADEEEITALLNARRQIDREEDDLEEENHSQEGGDDMSDEEERQPAAAARSPRLSDNADFKAKRPRDR